MNNLNSSEPEKVFRELSNAFQGLLTGKWDDRFQTVLAEFDTDNKAHIQNALAGPLDRIWDNANIEKAPMVVQSIADGFGGIMPGQLLFTSDPSRDTFVFCAWWPWGNGKTISIRLALFYQKASDSERAEGIQRLKECFGIRE